MSWGVMDVSASSARLLTSDRPVWIDNLSRPDAIIFIPIGPAKLFVATTDEAALRMVAAQNPGDIVARVNHVVAGRARRFVWAADKSQTSFIEGRMSAALEPLPLCPGISKYASAVLGICRTELTCGLE